MNKNYLKLRYCKLFEFGLSISILIIFVLSLHSCMFSGCKKKELSEEDLSWIDYYKYEDTIVFKSVCNLVDSIKLKKSHSFTQCNRLEFGEYIYEEMMVSFSLINNDNIDLGVIILNKEGNNPIRKIMCYDLFYNKSNNDSLLVNMGKIKTNFSIDSIEVFKFERDNHNLIVDENRSYQRKIKSFYWSKEYGLIQYETVEGCIFKLSPNSRILS